MSPTSRQVEAVVIGSGPGGYVAAIKLGQLGVQTLLIEKEATLGGICLNRGCIPSKALISAAHRYQTLTREAMGSSARGATLEVRSLQAWKGGLVTKLTLGVARLLRANQVEVLHGAVRFSGSHTLRVTPSMEQPGPERSIEVEFQQALIATGSLPSEIPGFEFDGQNILGSTEALDLPELPKRLLVIGGGYIGLELGTAWAQLGSRVTVVEMLPQLLPGFPRDMVSLVQRKLKRMGVHIHTRARATGWEKDTDGELVVTVETEGKDPISVQTDKVLVTVGRRPASAGLGLKTAGVDIDGHGFIATDAHQATSQPHIFAVGDVAGEPLLAHKASAEAEVAARVMAGQQIDFVAQGIPAVVFTDPEIASVGLTLARAKEQPIETLAGKFAFAANGRALSVDMAEGFVRVVAEAVGHRLLGVEIIGPEASTMISEAALALRLGARLEDIASTVHPHPSFSETLMEAAKAALGEAIHAVNR